MMWHQQSDAEGQLSQTLGVAVYPFVTNLTLLCATETRQMQAESLVRAHSLFQLFPFCFKAQFTPEAAQSVQP